MMVVSKDTLGVGGGVSHLINHLRGRVVYSTQLRTSQVILASLPKVNFSGFAIPKGKHTSTSTYTPQLGDYDRRYCRTDPTSKA